MKSIVILLLMICLAKFAGAQTPPRTGCQGPLATTACPPVADASRSVPFKL